MKKLLVLTAHNEDQDFIVGGTMSKLKTEGWEVILLPVVLKFDYQEGKLSDSPSGDLEEKIYQKLVEEVPDIIVTFATSGINNDPDHIRVCYATTFAFQKYARWIEEQLTARESEEVEQLEPKLYYACLPETLIEHLKEKKVIPAESFGKPIRGVADKTITTVVDIDASKKKMENLVLDESQEYFILRMKGTKEVFMGKNDEVAVEL